MSYLPEFIIYIDCILIVVAVLFTVEKSIIDIFSEQYGGNQRNQGSQVVLNRFIFLLFLVYFINSYFYLREVLTK